MPLFNHSQITYTSGVTGNALHLGRGIQITCSTKIPGCLSDLAVCHAGISIALWAKFEDGQDVQFVQYGAFSGKGFKVKYYGAG